ncbi:MAG: hypothetical protein OD817_06350, partial [Gammaproteobacteria bacterium]
PAKSYIIITDDEAATIAFGNNAASKNIYARTAAESQATLTLPVSVSHLPDVATTFTLVASGDATEPADYAVVTKNIIFQPDGARTQNLEITLAGDALFEPDEHIRLSFADSAGDSIARLYTRANTADITLSSDDSKPAVSLAANSLEVTEGGTAALTLQLNHASSQPVHVAYSGADITATSGADYLAGGAAIIPAGATVMDIDITPIDDAIQENTETFTLTIALADGESGAVLGEPASAVITILDNDTPRIGFQTLAHSATEGDDGTSELQLGISIVPALAEAGEITIGVNPGGGDTATAGADYVMPAASFALPAGAASANLALQITGDTTPEPDEVFRIKLSASDDAVYAIDAARNTAAVTISANDFALSFARALQIAPESAGIVNLDVALSHALSADFTGSLTFTAASAHGAEQPSDYTAAAEFTIAAGATTASIPVTLVDDADYEFTESASVLLLPDNARDVQIGATGATRLTLQDNDEPSIALVGADDASAATIAEGGALNLLVKILPADVGLGQRGIDFAAIRIDAAADADAATRDARNPEDYTSATMIAPNGHAISMLQAVDDNVHEGDEVFVVSLDADTLLAEGGGRLFAAAGKGSVVVTIADGDAPPMVAISIEPASIPDDRASEVTVTAATDQIPGYNELRARIPVSATPAPSNVAAAIGDFVIDIPPGMQSASTTFTVTPVFDVGGSIAFAITDAIENAAKGAGATLAIIEGSTELQMGTVVAANGQPIAENN